MSLLTVVSVYYFYYYIKRWSKQKHILPCCYNNNELTEIDIIYIKEINIKNSRCYYLYDILMILI